MRREPLTPAGTAEAPRGVQEPLPARSDTRRCHLRNALKVTNPQSGRTDWCCRGRAHQCLGGARGRPGAARDLCARNHRTELHTQELRPLPTRTKGARSAARARCCACGSGLRFQQPALGKRWGRCHRHHVHDGLCIIIQHKKSKNNSSLITARGGDSPLFG